MMHSWCGSFSTISYDLYSILFLFFWGGCSLLILLWTQFVNAQSMWAASKIFSCICKSVSSCAMSKYYTCISPHIHVHYICVRIERKCSNNVAHKISNKLKVIIIIITFFFSFILVLFSILFFLFSSRVFAGLIIRSHFFCFCFTFSLALIVAKLFKTKTNCRKKNM